MPTKKSLGQHWLYDPKTLTAIVKAGEINQQDTILEIGPGTGNLTDLLLKKAKKVIAIEKDEALALELSQKRSTANLEVIPGDILKFDLRQLPKNYKVVANIPYYLTSNLLRQLLESPNPPKLMALLVQKEVAERIVAGPGQMSLLAFSVQYYSQPKLTQIVPKEVFSPPPKVDSSLIQIKRRPKPYFDADAQRLFRIVKAGFAGKRKQLKNSLSAGLQLPPANVSRVLKKIRINPEARAQELTLVEWQKIYQQIPID